MTFMEFILLVAVAGCSGVGASTLLTSMIDRIGRTPEPQPIGRDLRTGS